MSYIYKEISFPSSDGKNTVHAELYIPEGGEVRGVVQLSHGMIDYVGRYKGLAEYLTERGFVFAGGDHLGHGATAAVPEDFGYFAPRDGWRLVIDDLYKMNSILHERFTGLPVVLLGHSMGSFLARLYAEKYPESITGIIIHGTAGKNPILPLGLALTRVMKLFLGERHRSAFIRSLADGGYNKSFDPAEGVGAWLTRDGSMVSGRGDDPKTSFGFTLSGYIDLFTMLGKCNSKKWFKNYPKQLPTLIMSGECDPVGDFGKGVRFVHGGLEKNGVCDLSLKLYEGARHELFNETNRDEVFADIAVWLSRVTGEL